MKKKKLPKVNEIQGIFLLFEGLPPTIIESQVLTHVRLMGEAGIRIEVWAFAINKKSYSQARDTLPRFLNDYPITIRLFRGVNSWLPFSDFMNALLLLWKLWRCKARPQFVHARTERAATIAIISKKLLHFRLIWDSRGDSISELTVKIHEFNYLLKWLVGAVQKMKISGRLRLAALNCDAAIFVSEALRSLNNKLIPHKQTLIVPCLSDESEFYYSPEIRKAVRSELGFHEDDQVITYVGSTAPWQCVDETTSLMKRVLETNPAFRVLIVTPDTQTFKSMFPASLKDRVHIVSATLKEINRFLNAADFGMLIRKKNPINWVASPVKFAEYSLAGLTVVTTNAVEQVVKIGGEIGNIIYEDNFLNHEQTTEARLKNRPEIASRAQSLLGRDGYKEKLVCFYNALMASRPQEDG